MYMQCMNLCTYIIRMLYYEVDFRISNLICTFSKMVGGQNYRVHKLKKHSFCLSQFENVKAINY